MPHVAGKRVLDFGAGSGAISIAAGLLRASSIVACDIDPGALCLVQSNALQHSCHQIETLLVKKNSALALQDRRFDLILCNPASLSTKEHCNSFWSGGKYGIDMIKQVIKLAAKHLEPEGQLHIVHTSLASLQRSIHCLARHHFASRIMDSQPVYFRDHYTVLLPYFCELRAKGEIYFDAKGNTRFEVLYLVEARRFMTQNCL
jgi:methylase of polypeptide subunit release factors